MSKWMSEFIAAQCLRAGALAAHIPALGNLLASRGYARSTAKEQIRVVAEFGRWIDLKKVRVSEIDERRLGAFLAYRRRRGLAMRSHATTLRILLSVLRDSRVVPLPASSGGKAAIDRVAEVERAFARHLTEERGLRASTLGNYISPIRQLLSARYHGRSVRLDLLRPDDVSRFVVRTARSQPGRIKVVVPALRAFLRWAHQRGDTKTSLVGCVPAVADWRAATLPKSLPTEQVERLLQHCDRTTVVGRRDYAILLLLARLGLRASEVVAMELDDIDWEGGELVVRGKGGREERLPWPRSVGAAVAAYLRDGRPNCSTRRVFVRSKAPLRGFVGPVAICDVVRRGLKRAGLDPQRKGAHTLRHALACTMLRRGASLAEIGQLLRHRSPDTTAIYAKVDLVALRALAPTWPHSAGDT